MPAFLHLERFSSLDALEVNAQVRSQLAPPTLPASICHVAHRSTWCGRRISDSARARRRVRLGSEALADNWIGHRLFQRLRRPPLAGGTSARSRADLVE